MDTHSTRYATREAPAGVHAAEGVGGHLGHRICACARTVALSLRQVRPGARRVTPSYKNPVTLASWDTISNAARRNPLPVDIRENG